MEYEPYQAKSVNSHDHTIKFLSFIHKHLQIMIMKITIAYWSAGNILVMYRYLPLLFRVMRIWGLGLTVQTCLQVSKLSKEGFRLWYWRGQK